MTFQVPFVFHVLNPQAKIPADARTVWQSPTLDESVLDAYRKKPTAKTEYSLQDHPHLLGSMAQFFEAFRKQVLALNPCVTEEYLKLYVAYKAETNFVDVVPQAKRFRLSINMAFSDINDPKGLCKDTTNLGRWGNGDVEVKLSSLDEIPYVMGLIRQSFEQQMGNGD